MARVFDNGLYRFPVTPVMGRWLRRQHLPVDVTTVPAPDLSGLPPKVREGLSEAYRVARDLMCDGATDNYARFLATHVIWQLIPKLANAVRFGRSDTVFLMASKLGENLATIRVMQHAADAKRGKRDKEQKRRASRKASAVKRRRAGLLAMKIRAAWAEMKPLYTKSKAVPTIAERCDCSERTVWTVLRD